MGSFRSSAFLALFFLLLASAFGQKADLTTVPRVVKYTGSAPAGTASVSFAIYATEDGVAPLWLETQSVTADETGHYTVLLGSTKSDGLPASIFASGDARWIGVKVGDAPEGARTLLVSVPYALKAGDAETLGGKPLSAFLLADANASSPSAVSSSKGQRLKSNAETGRANPDPTAPGDSGTQNHLAKFMPDGVTLGDSAIVEVSGRLGIGTAFPNFPLELVGSNVELLQRNPSPTGYSGMRFYNDQNSSSHALEIDYSGTAYPGALIGAGPSGEQTSITNNGPYPMTFGTNNTARITIAGSGNVGIGTSSPNFPLELVGSNVAFLQRNPSATSYAGMRFYNDQNNALRALEIDYSGSAYPGALIGGGPSGEQTSITNNGPYPMSFGTNNTARITILGSGNVGVGTSSPSAALDVAGVVRAGSGVKFGDATVQTTAATLTGVATGANSGLTGGGTSGTLSLSLLTTCSANQILKWSGTAWACAADQSGSGGLTFPFDSGPQSTTSGAFLVRQTNGVALLSDPDFTFATTQITAGVVWYAQTTNTANTATGVAALSNSPNSPALVAWNGSTGATGSSDAQGIISQTDNPAGTALEATARATSGNTFAIKAQIKSPNGVALYAQDNSGTGTAALFQGKVEVQSGTLVIDNAIAGNGFALPVTGGMNVQGNTTINGNLSVQGNLSKMTGTFKIDHPLDPAGKYLIHSFVESPDMMNIYNGIVTLDSKGRATIAMPDYFEALNMDFRYQLTAMGASMPGLYIAKEVEQNRFQIAGGKPNAKVSWQVTGIRHDAYANAHRIQVEVDKGAERGTYLAPELFTKAGSDKVADNHK